MPSQVSLTPPQDNVTDVSASFWNTELGKIVNALNQLIQGLFGSTDITTTGDMNARDFTASRNVEVGNGLTIQGTTEITSILDEDDMASDSATALATQQSIKAYIDNKNFSAAETTDIHQSGGAGSALAFDTTYTALVDGFVFGYVQVSAGANINTYLNGTIVKKSGGTMEDEFDLTVAAGDTWKITSQGTENESNLMFRPRS